MPVNALVPIGLEGSSARPTYPLYPPLGKSEDIKLFAEDGRAVAFALSPRGNEFTVFETVKDLSIPALKRAHVMYFGHWDRIRRDDSHLFIESFLTFQTLQTAASLPQSDTTSLQAPELVRGCHKALTAYQENLWAHLDRLDTSQVSRFVHYSEVASTMQLLQLLFTSDSGNISSTLVGEETLYWLNVNYISPSAEEGPALDAFEKPWLQDEFWEFVFKALLRGITKTATHFVKRLAASHPSRPLKRLMTELTPIIQNHPRSKDFDTEFEYFTAHRRWRETSVGGFRKRVDDLDEDDGRGFQPDGGEWRDQVESLCKILEGDRETYFDVAKGWDWDWRDALGVWGVWFDIKLTRESFPATLPLILERLPLNPNQADELIQTALISFDTKTAIEGARRWDLWFAAHAADILEKLGELEGFSLQTSLDLSLRATLLIEYAEHIYTDPSLWRVTLEYLGACGSEGAAMAAELIKRVSIDIDFPTDISDATVVVTEKDPRPSCFTPDGGTPASRAWAEWEDKVLKIITVCKDYGLEEVLTSVCKSISQALIRRGLYGRAMAYSVMAQDARGVGQIADLLLHEYIAKGRDEFRAQAATIPSEHLATGCVFSSRLQFIARYAEFHDMIDKDEFRDAARLLVVMLSAKIVPRSWWGVILLDAGGMLDNAEMLFTQDDAYELLRHLEEIYTRAEQGAGADYLGALDRIMRKSSEVNDAVDIESALSQLQVVRLAIARYLARCSVGVSRLY